MQFEEADTPQLKTWLVKRLEDISDADSDVLADYVLALVKSDEPEDQVKANCMENLEDFLQDQTPKFVEDVFNAVGTKSYIPGYKAPQQAPPSGSFSAPAGPKHLNGATSNFQPDPSRKRASNDRDGSQPSDTRDPHYNRNNGGERATKQSRRGAPVGGRGGRGGQNGFGAPSGGIQQQFPAAPAMASPPPGFPSLDPNNPMAAIMAMQAMGFPSLPGFGQFPGQSSSPTGSQQPAPSRGRCRDYDTKGYCAAGSMCPYEHGSDHIVVPESLAEYDPKTASLSPDFNTSPNAPFDNSRPRGNARGRARGARSGRGNQSSRAPFSYNGPMKNHTVTSIVVEQIPEDKFNDADVRSFFEEFGVIEDINMQPYKRLAVVKFTDHGSARRAYESPKVIFDNRFVKVYWYKPEAVNEETAAAVKGIPLPIAAPEKKVQEDEDMIDLEEFAQKQAEAQRAHEAKLLKLKEAEAAREELETRMKAQAEERRELLEKLAAKTVGAAARSATPSGTSGNSSNIGLPTPTDGPSKASAQTEALRAKLAELEAEAETLGLAPDDSTTPLFSHGAPRGRGAYNPAYARGGYRGGYVPRGRGGGVWRGVTGGGGAVARLDNRPKTVEVRAVDGGVDFGEAKVEESLRAHLFGIGEFSSITASSTSAIVAFPQRYIAEMFISQSSSIPGIGKITHSWVANSNAPATPTPTTAAATAVSGKAGNADSHGASDKVMSGIEGSEKEKGNGSGDVDYDVADEDEDRWMR